MAPTSVEPLQRVRLRQCGNYPLQPGRGSGLVQPDGVIDRTHVV